MGHCADTCGRDDLRLNWPLQAESGEQLVGKLAICEFIRYRGRALGSETESNDSCTRALGGKSNREPKAD